jgi:putative DNA primase/helicase
MIQILGIRDFTTPTGEVKRYETFFHKEWRAQSVIDLFNRLEDISSQIPGAERVNLFYTAASCEEVEGRKFVSQNIIPFDVDHIDVSRAQEYIAPICKALGVPEDAIACVMSGHGVQLIVATETSFFDAAYFDSARPHYREACNAINEALTGAGLTGLVDDSVWTPARLLRLPGTMNHKPNKEPVEAKLLVNNLRPLPWSLTSAFCTDNSHLEATIGDAVSEEAIRKIQNFDEEGVLNECEFIKWTRDNANSVSEPQWYAMLSVVSRLPNGRKLCHDISSNYSEYSSDETDLKIDQAIARSGPRTCGSIEQLYGGCSECKHYRKVLSPISIKGDTYIKTIDTGFHFVTYKDDGTPKSYKPDYEGLRKFFEQKHTYVTSSSGHTYIFNGKFWEILSNSQIEAFALEHFQPLALDSTRQEFRKLLQTTNFKDDDWFESHKFLNMDNGVLDMDTQTLHQHSKEYGFTYVLPYGFNPQAEAPRFNQFLKEVTQNDQELIDVLLEFVGFSVSNTDPALYEKCLILLGDGSNGKSVFIDVLKSLVGKKNYSALTLDELKKETNRAQLNNKLLNVAEETPYKGMTDSSVFKNLITGGELTVKELYRQPYRIKSRAKFVFACNELPTTYDPTNGMFRRLLIAPFNATFDASNRDIHLRSKLLKELEGIFNLALTALLRLKRNGCFTSADTIETEVKDFRDSMDTIRQWVSDSLILDDRSAVSVTTMYRDYVMYCQDRKIYTSTMAILSKRLGKMYPTLERKRVQESGRKSTVIVGLKLLSSNGANF